MDQALTEVFVALPGVVDKYNPVTQTADVLPLLKRPYVNQDASEGTDDIPIVPQVPVWFPRGGGFFMSLPLQKGDNVLLVICDQSLENYVAGDGATQVDPVDLRQHDISDAIAIPGGGVLSKAIKTIIASGAYFGKENGPGLRVSDAAVEVVTGGAPAAVGGFVAMSLLVDAIFATLDGVFRGWTPVAQDGGAALKTAYLAAFPSPPTSTASKNLKAD